MAFLPFHEYYQSFNSGLNVSRWQTPIDRFLGIHGLFLFVIATFLVYSARKTLMGLAGSRILAVAGIRRSSEPPLASGPAVIWLRWVLGLGLLIATVLAIAGYWTVVLLLIFLALTGLSAWDILGSRNQERTFASVPMVLLALALAIAIGTDFLRVEGDIGRMNTLFKYYLEVWVLLSLAAAYMLWQLLSGGLFRRRTWLGRAWLAALALLIGSSLIYTALGTQTRLDLRFNPTPPTIDGAAYMQSAVHRARGYDRSPPLQLKWDAGAIRWLQDNVSGSPVVLEAHNEQYTWSSRIADYTGLPTVLGWPWHQRQQRWGYQYAVFDRAGQVREIYDTTDIGRAQGLLQQYGVKYVVVGGLERLYYSQEGLGKFDELTAQGRMQLVYENQGVSIYQVN